MKFHKKLFCFFATFLIFTFENYADDDVYILGSKFPFTIYSNSKFHHPLETEAIGLYNKFSFSLNASDRRDENDYRRLRQIEFEGEFKILNNLSGSIKSGYSVFDKTDSGSFRGRDRIRVGLKYAQEINNWIFALGMFQFSRNQFQPKSETNNPDFFIIRPYAGIGYRWNQFQIQSNIHFQTESNEIFRERLNEEFRRHYQANLVVSLDLLESLVGYLEFAKRQPYDETVDTETRFATIYPGFMLKTENWGNFGLSTGFPLINERINDRSIRFQYFYFW